MLVVSLPAQEAAGAMLRSDGVGVLVNKNPAPTSIALYRSDLVETEKTAVARIEVAGSSADLNPESMVEFDVGELVLDHGSLSVNTSRGLRVRVGCLTVTPVREAEWTHYEVADVDGKVTVSAQKNDVYIDERSNKVQDTKREEKSRSIVHETEQKTRDEKCGAGVYQPTHGVGGPSAILNTRWAQIGGIGAVGVITCWALCRHEDPISPARPN